MLRDISTVQTYKTTLLNAKSIGYSHGCSGTNIAKGIDELGLTEQLKAKTVFADDRPIVEYLGVGDSSATLVLFRVFEAFAFRRWSATHRSVRLSSSLSCAWE